MMAAQPKAKGGDNFRAANATRVGFQTTHTSEPVRPSATITLAAAGIDKNLTKRARKLAPIPNYPALGG
jgi:hypothetical protein